MSQDNNPAPKRSDNKSNAVGPTFFLSLFLLIGGVVLVWLIYMQMNEHEIPYRDLVRLIENSKRDEQGKLIRPVTGEIIVSRENANGTLEQLRYSNLRDVR